MTRMRSAVVYATCIIIIRIHAAVQVIVEAAYSYISGTALERLIKIIIIERIKDLANS